MARKRYRSKGGWVMGTWWAAGRTGWLHELQAAAYVPYILEPIDRDGKVIPAAPPKPPVKKAAPPGPRRSTHLPPEGAQRPRRRVGMTAGLSTGMSIHQASLASLTPKADVSDKPGGNASA